MPTVLSGSARLDRAVAVAIGRRMVLSLRSIVSLVLMAALACSGDSTSQGTRGSPGSSSAGNAAGTAAGTSDVDLTDAGAESADTSYADLADAGAIDSAPNNAATSSTSDADADAGNAGMDASAEPPTLPTTPPTAGSDASSAQLCTTDCSHCGPLEECFDGRFCVATAVLITAADQPSYTIDATEVTKCQYAAWLATQPSSAGQDTWCADQTDFQPDPQCLQSEATCTSDCAAHPQVCVTFCSAMAYCRAVGKRLCGKIGGGSAPFDAPADAQLDQWFNACSSGGTLTYPYANTYDPQACNGYDNSQTGCQSGSCMLRPAGELVTCQSPVPGYTGVFDLSGSVFEWQDSCNAEVGGQDRCRFRGGSFVSSYGDDHGNALRCGYDIAGSRDDRYSNLGFRCCGR